MDALRTLRRAFGPGSKRETVHMLHVSKTAGSHMRKIAKIINQEPGLPRIKVHQHEIGLIDLPEHAPYFFGTRNPITRFHAGFYSSKKWSAAQDQTHQWAAHSRDAFARFEHSNDLAEALFEDGERGLAATRAMRSIRHSSRNFVDWFKFLGSAFEVRPPVWILRQEHFADDLSVLLSRLGVPQTLLPTIERTHTTDYSEIPPLSDKAKANLTKWYVQDFEFLKLCSAWMEQNLSNPQTDMSSGASGLQGVRVAQ